MAQGVFNKGNIIEGNAWLSIAAGSRYAIYDAFGLDGKYDEHAWIHLKVWYWARILLYRASDDGVGTFSIVYLGFGRWAQI